MKSIGRFFTNPTVISVIGLILIALIIWFAGPHIKFGESNTAPLGSAVARLVAIIVIVLLWGLNNLRIQHKNAKCNRELADDLQQGQQEPTADTSSDQASEEIHQINERFSQALATLNKLRFKSKGRSKALYELPWYIIIGPPGSGKTTALVNSGLEFPLGEQFGKGALQGVGGTRNCDWWFTNDAVMIDTAGRYTTQDSHRVVDSSAWEGFLNLLKRHRRRRPINGAIVAISLHDLLLQSEDERTQHAKTIRARLDELMSKLEIHFPVYLMFTKADLVSGFSEFFEDLGKEERDQVWGVSLPNAAKASQCPDFDFLSAELRKLADRLYDRVLWRMHQERDVRRCASIQGFPQQIENLNSIVEEFVRQTFMQNRYEKQPYLRGVYLSSGTQDGTPIDRLMTSVAAGFGFSRETAQLPSQKGKSFFISRLLREVIFPEAELVGANARYERFIRWSQRAAYVGLGAVTLVVLLVWSGSITRHKMYMSEVASYVDEFNQENQRVTQWNRDIRATLPPLDALAKASIVYDQESLPWLSGIGLYDGRIDHEADLAYKTHLLGMFQPRLLEPLEDVLRQGDPQGDLYNTFRIYMMFNRTEHMDKSLIREWFTAHWNSELHGEASRRQALGAHLDALLQFDLEPVELNDQVVRQTRSSLLRLPVAQRVYSRLRTHPEYSQQIDLVSHFGDGVRNLYKMDDQVRDALSIPAMFTLQGYKALDFSVESPFVSDVLNERWILSDETNTRVDFVKDDLNEISSEVKEHYMADYVRVWRDVYAALDVAAFNNLRQAGDVLAELSDPVYSPLRAILQVGLTNTQLTPPVAELAEHAEGGAGRLGRLGKVASIAAGHIEGTTVDKRFHDLHVLMQESSRGPAPVENIMGRIQELQAYLRELSMAPDPGKAAFTIAKARFESGTGNPITALRSFATTVPDEPVGRWLTTLADESWRVVLNTAHQHINNEWQAQVYGPYNRGLAGRYPLNRAASNEVALYDFSGFFKPSGTVDTFYREFIEPFVDTRGTWNNRVVDGYTTGFSATALTQVQRALRIRDAFFKQNPETPTVELELRPVNMDKNDARFVLDMGEQRISYNHGPKFWSSVKWTGGNSDQRIRIIFEDLNGASHDQMYTGNWPWFRLMDDADLQKTTQSNLYQITFSIDENSAAQRIVYEGRARSVNNPFNADLLTGFKCPETI